MSSAKLFGGVFNLKLEEEGGGDGSSIPMEVCRSGILQDCNPYFHLLGSNSDSGSVSMDTRPQLIDFFQREAHHTVRDIGVSSYQRVSSSSDFNIWEDIELGLRLESRSGSGSGESCVAVVHTEIDSGRVEVGTDITHVEDNLSEAMVLDEELEWENWQNAVEEHVQVIPTIHDWPLLFNDSSSFGDFDLGTFVASIYGEMFGEDDPFVQIPDNMDGFMGSPPTSKRVVDDLPNVVITSEQLSNGNTMVCAICKDDIVVEEKAKRFPCKHYYHGECIIPWLRIRNTCPVCRYELPTDDLEYERNKRTQSRGSSGPVRLDEVML